MRSKITKLADYRKAALPREIDLRCPPEVVEKKLRLITKEGKTTVKPETVEKGDVVTLALESALPRFNRPAVPVNVGSGMYDPELEAALVGRKVGDSFTTPVQGTPVQVTVKSALRNVYPQPTDTMAAAYAKGRDGMEDVKTVSDYVEYVKKDYREDRRLTEMGKAVNGILDYVFANSEFELDEGELQEVLDREIDLARRDAAEEKMDYDAMTDEEIRRFTGMDSRADFEEMLRRGCRDELMRYAWAQAVIGPEPEDAEEGWVYSATWDFLEKYVTENVTIID